MVGGLQTGTVVIRFRARLPHSKAKNPMAYGSPSANYQGLNTLLGDGTPTAH